MFNFRRSREATDPLAHPTPQTTAHYLSKLLEETNLLLREILRALEHPHHVPITGRPLGSVPRIRTANDVFRVTRQTLEEAAAKRREAEDAPWRTPESGPASASTSTPAGNAIAGEGTPSAPPRTTSPTPKP